MKEKYFIYLQKKRRKRKWAKRMEKGVADLEVLDLKGKGLIVYYDGKKHYVTVVEHSENTTLSDQIKIVDDLEKYIFEKIN